MDAEDYAGFGWLFGIWQDTVLSLLAATSPVFEAIGASSVALVGAVGFLWLTLVLLRVADVGLVRGLVGGALIFGLLLLGMRPATFAQPGRAALPLLEIQSVPLKFALNVHGIYASSLNQVMREHQVAGQIVPAQKAVDDAIERSASLYEGSDLAQLIRDYNQSCAPSRTAVAGPEHETAVEAYHAIGLLGGGGLGIPDEAVSVLSQAKAAATGFWTYVYGDKADNGGWFNWIYGGAAREGAMKAYDLGSVRDRRSAGVRALEQAKRPFLGSSAGYALPTQGHWEATFQGRANVNPDYLATSQIPDVETMATHPDRPSLLFIPRDCVQAYRVAQLGAEQAYKALEAIGGEPSEGHSASAQNGTISAGIAWQRLLSRSLSGTGEVSGGSAFAAGGILAGFQMFKNWQAWLELQTLLPMYAIGMAGLFSLALSAGPIALLIAPLRGIQVVISWLSMLLFPLLAMVFAHTIAIATSLAMAGISAGQAAMASGWSGAGADLDGLRAGLGIVAAMMLGVATWLASSLTGVSISGLAGSARGAVATTSDAASIVAKVVGGMAVLARFGGARGAGIAPSSKSDISGGGNSSSGVRPTRPNPPPVSPPTRPTGASNDKLRAKGISLTPTRAPQTNALKMANDKKVRAQAGFERLRRKLDKQREE
jgi:hypothetical protein